MRDMQTKWSSTPQMPVHRYEFVDRPGFAESVKRLLDRNLGSFEGNLTFANDYAYGVLAGGSGLGKTISGFEIVDRLQKERPNYCVVHCFLLPGASPLGIEPRPTWSRQGRPPRTGENGNKPLSLGIAASYFLKNFSLKAQADLYQWDSRCLDLDFVISSIRYNEKLSDTTPLALVVQLDEFQEGWFTSLVMLRAISDNIRSGDFQRHNCIIIPVLTGTAPNTVSYIETHVKVTDYHAQIFTIAPLKLEESLILAKHYAKYRNSSFDMSQYASSRLFRHVLECVGGIPRVIEMFVDIALSSTPSARLNTVEDALTMFTLLMSKISNRYELSDILQALGGQGPDALKHGEACLRQLVSLSYFQEAVTRSTPLNGATIGDLESSGIIFLRPVREDPQAELEPEKTFFIYLPRLFYFYFSQHIPTWNDPFPQIILRGGIQLTEDNFPVFILHLHRATYTVFTWKRCYTALNPCHATLRDIYDDAAIALGDPSILDQPLVVQSDVEYRECPQQAEDGTAYIVTNASSVRVRSSSQAMPFDIVDLTTGRYLVLTRKRAADVDALTPHGREQYKWSNYVASGFTIPVGAENKNTMYITEQLIKKERKKGSVMNEKPFIIISPKKLLSSENKVIESQDQVRTPWFPTENVLAVCGQNLLKFSRGFLTELSFPQGTQCLFII